MRGADIHEQERLRAIDGLDLLDSCDDPELDQLAHVAAALFRVPVALLTITAETRNWFKARFGTDLKESPRDISFCDWAIRGRELFEVTDLAADPRFAANPLVAEPPHLRYYAGIPIYIGDHAIGTLCLLDYAVRPLMDPAARQSLRELANLAVTLINARKLRQVGVIANALSQATPDAIVCAGADGLITAWNAGAETLFGYGAGEAIGHPLNIIIPPAMRHLHTTGVARYLATDQPKLVGRTVEVPAIHKAGHEISVELSLSSWKDEHGRTAGFGAIIRDLSARKALEDERTRAQGFADQICENLPATLFVKDAKTRKYLLMNKAGEEMTGLPAAEIVGRTDAEIWPNEAAGYVERDNRVLETGASETFESNVVHTDGSPRVLRTKRVSVRDAEGRPLYLLGIGEDVTEWRRAQQQLAFVAGHDGLTGLYNRDHFLWNVDVGLADHCPPGDRHGGEVALLALDIDRFSSIVGAYGRHAADELLVDVAERVRAAIKPGCSASRFDADRFFIMIPGARAGQRAEVLARELLAGLARRHVDDHGPQPRARIGVAVAPHDADTAEGLVASAELAALRAKGTGIGGDLDPAASGWRVAFFERAQDDAARRRRAIEERLGLAIAQGKIDVHYQPLIRLSDRRMSGYEALARWIDPELGIVSPVEFIPIAEEVGLIGRLGASVLAKAAHEAARWDDDLVLSVNFSAAQFSEEGLVDQVSRALRAARLDPRRLEVEITESLLIKPHERVMNTLRGLKAMGATIAMDDFGTGYSSLSYFCSFPFDKVKIDQTFIRDMTTSREARAIVRAVIGLAHGMGMKVAGEGVETADQLAALSAEGCDLAQGFLIGRPAAAAAPAVSSAFDADDALSPACDAGDSFVPRQVRVAGRGL